MRSLFWLRFYLILPIFIFGIPGSAEPEFWPTVRRILVELDATSISGFRRLGNSPGAVVRLAGAQEKPPSWTSNLDPNSKLNSTARPYGKTVRQLALMLEPQYGLQVLVAAQRDRRVELGLPRESEPESPLLRFIESEEREFRLPFRLSARLAGAQGLDLSERSSNQFLTGRFIGSVWIDSALPRIIHWIESTAAPAVTRIRAIEELRAWYAVRRAEAPSPHPRSVPEDLSAVLADFTLRAGTRSDHVLFHPSPVTVSSRSYDVLRVLRRAALSGTQLHAELRMDRGQLSKLLRPLVDQDLVWSEKLGRSNVLRAYGLTRKGRALLAGFPTFEQWQSAAADHGLLERSRDSEPFRSLLDGYSHTMDRYGSVAREERLNCKQESAFTALREEFLREISNMRFQPENRCADSLNILSSLLGKMDGLLSQAARWRD